MPEKNEPVDIDPSKATPLEAVEPTEVPAVMGATFAERKAAASKRAPDQKAVESEDSSVEDKAVKPRSTRAKKKS
jgi:hypothetical protein